MDPRLTLLSSLFVDIEDYTAQSETSDKNGFLAYLNRKYQASIADIEEAPEETKRDAVRLMEENADQGAILAFHLHRLGKYAKYYIKESFKGSALLTADDFGFLAAIIEHKEISKTELISYNLHEVPSGMEVIRRLINRGLVKERVNRDDRRIKILSHTEKGLHEFLAATARMQEIAKIITGDLSKEELTLLNGTLRRLDYYHELIHRKAEETNSSNLSIALRPK